MNKMIHCTGEVRVSLPLERAIEMFTPEGEREWVPGWEPSYPAGRPEGRPAGTVFVTEAAGRETTWVIIESEERAIRYARLTPGVSAGTVSVRCRPDGDATIATVAYHLTALTDEAGDDLDELAAAYPDHMAEWERLIGEALATHA